MRKSRIYPLCQMASSLKNNYYDKVFFYPINEPIHMWLISTCTSATIYLDHFSYTPQNVYSTERGYAIDYGIFTYPTGSFGQLRISNINDTELRDSFLIITRQLDWFPCGNIENIERSLWGISRAEAGRSMISPAAVTVGTPIEFRVYYTPSTMLPCGTRIRFGVPFAFSYPQTEFPDQPGFVSIQGHFKSLKLQEISKEQEGHERVYIIYELCENLSAHEFIELSYQTDNVYLYPQIYSENEMEFWYTRTPVLNVSVALPDREDYVFLCDDMAHRVEFLPDRPQKLHLFLPGRLHSGEKAVLHGLFTDKYHNPCRNNRPNFRFTLYIQHENNPLQKVISPVIYQDFASFHVELSVDKPGIYRISALDSNGNILSESNPLQIIDITDKSPNIYWGEIHAHCEMSDGIGTYTDLFRFGRDIASLDFAASADHACYFSDNEWETMQDICNSYNCDGSYTTLIGYEWAGKQVHRNIYTSQNHLKLFRAMYEPTSTLDKVYNFFHGNEDVVAGPHGSIAHGLIFEHHDPTVERFIEIYSMWGDQDNLNGNHSPAKVSPNAIPINELIKTDVHLGFTGGGDCHEAHPGFSSCDPEHQGQVPHAFAQFLRYRCGLTAACMPKLNRTNLIAALRNRHTYATSGARILADFTINGYSMGEIVMMKEHIICLRCEYHLTDYSGTIYIIKNGEELDHAKLVERDGTFEWNGDISDSQEEISYYIKIVQEDSQTLWSSPIWIRYTNNS